MHRLAKTIVQQKIKKERLDKTITNFPKICFSILE